MINEKLNFLAEAFKRTGDFKINYVNTKTKQTWVKAKLYSETTEDEKIKANLRQIFPDEIVLDLESKKQLDEVLVKLKTKNWAYEIWATGSRGYHIHLFFDNLANLSKKERNAIRKKIIKDEFKTDPAKSSEDTFLAIRYTKHFKGTGGIKLPLK